jgi:NADH-quinone oxidoreductase subunit K
VAFSRANGVNGVPVYDPQVLALFVVAIAAAEVAIGLALIVAMFRARRTVSSAALNTLKED